GMRPLEGPYGRVDHAGVLRQSDELKVERAVDAGALLPVLRQILLDGEVDLYVGHTDEHAAVVAVSDPPHLGGEGVHLRLVRRERREEAVVGEVPLLPLRVERVVAKPRVLDDAGAGGAGVPAAR